MPQCCVSAAEWGVVQLTYAYDPKERFSSLARPFKHLTPPALHVTRFECGKHAVTCPPYCITIPIQEKFQTLEAELQTVIDDHHNHLVWRNHSIEQYFRLKGELDARMRVGHKIILLYIIVDLLYMIH
jgi:hypothetical protein